MLIGILLFGNEKTAAVPPGCRRSRVPYRRGEGRRQGEAPGRRAVDQMKRLETDFSLAVRLIASPISGAIEGMRMLEAVFTASVGWIESVITSSFSIEPPMRATAPPESTPWVM